MLKYQNYDIVFQEVPNEVTLAINITNCPNRCKGCHSPHLQKDIGETLNEDTLVGLLAKYASAITCICFMGGDNNPAAVSDLAKFIHKAHSGIKTAWYSGCAELPPDLNIEHFEFIKLGGYNEDFGSLKSKSSNQRLFQIQQNGEMKDVSSNFYR